MNRALSYLLACSARNRLKRHVLRLRQPRYAIALLAGLAYVGVFIASQGDPVPWEGRGAVPPWLPLVGSLALALLTARWWLFGEDRGILAYRPAEVQFLFPAPISRGTLLRWKLVRAQGPILLNTLLWTVIVNRQSGRWFDALSFWLLFSTLHLHRLGAALVRTSVREHGRRGARSHAVALLVFVAIGAGVLAGLALHWPDIRIAWGVSSGSLASAVSDALSSRWPGIALAPFRAMLAPLRAPSSEAWVFAVWPAALLLIVHYFWVVRSDAAFMETAVETGEMRVQAARERQERGVLHAAVKHRRPWFALGPVGSPARAILWKNILQVTRKVSPLLLSVGLLAAVLVPVFAAATGEGKWATMTGAFGLGVTAMLVVFGPVRIRNDLRGEMAHIGQLRSWPVESSSLVAAEVSAAILVLTVWEYGMMALSVLALMLGGEITSVAPGLALAMVGGLLLLPVFNVFAVVLLNAGVLLFPAWVRSSPGRGGVDALGQQMLVILATVLLVAICLVPPVILAGVAYQSIQHLSFIAGITSGVMVFLAGCLYEVWLLVSWMGRVFGELDPSEIWLEEAAGS